jgi:mannosyltransferase
MFSLKQMDSRLKARWILFLFLILALDLRVLWLGSKSLWLDEANSIHVAKVGQSELWAGHSEGYHPPLFYGLLEYWLQFGESESALRLPQAIAGAACVLLVYALAADLARTQVALSAAALTAFSPLLIWYSQELRPYSLLAALGLIGVIALLRLLTRPHIGWWLLFASVTTAALYLHYAAVLLFPVQWLLVIALLAAQRARRIGVVAWLGGLVVALAAFLPWLASPAFEVFIRNQLASGGYVGDLLNSHFNIKLEMSQVIGELLVLALIVVVALTFALYPLMRRLYQRGTLEKLRSSKPLHVSAVLLFIALLIASVVPQAYSLKRQLVVVWPVALLGFGWLWPWQQRNYKLLVFVLGLSLAASIVNLALVPKDQWRETADYIYTQVESNDIVLLEPEYMTIPFDYYNHQRVERLGAPFDANNDLLHKLACQHDRIRLVEHTVDHDPLERTQQWLNARAAPVSTTRFFRIDIRLYQLDRGSAQCAP